MTNPSGVDDGYKENSVYSKKSSVVKTSVRAQMKNFRQSVTDKTKSRYHLVIDKLS